MKQGEGRVLVEGSLHFLKSGSSVTGSVHGRIIWDQQAFRTSAGSRFDMDPFDFLEPTPNSKNKKNKKENVATSQDQKKYQHKKGGSEHSVSDLYKKLTHLKLNDTAPDKSSPFYTGINKEKRSTRKIPLCHDNTLSKNSSHNEKGVKKINYKQQNLLESQCSNFRSSVRSLISNEDMSESLIRDKSRFHNYKRRGNGLNNQESKFCSSSRHKQQNLMRTHCSSVGSSISSLISNEDMGESLIRDQSRFHNYKRRDNGLNNQESKFSSSSRHQQHNLMRTHCSSVGSSISSLISNEDMGESLIRDKSRFHNYKRRDNGLNNQESKFSSSSRHQQHNLMRTHCSSVGSSISSLISNEDMGESLIRDQSRFHNYKRRGIFEDQPTFHFSPDNINGLVVSKNDEFVTKYLFKNKSGLKNLFTTFRKVNEMRMTIKLLIRIGNITDKLSKEHFFSLALNKQFTEGLSNYLSCILLESSDENLKTNLVELLTVYSEIVHLIPSEMLQDFSELFMNSLSKMEKLSNIPTSIINNMQELITKISEKLKHTAMQLDSDDLCVLPRKKDLYENPELQPNIVEGPYESLSHYLEIQFKLYKEDFVSGLRSGLLEYEESLKEKGVTRYKDIFVYNAVFCGIIKHVQNKLTLALEVDNKKLKNVNWETSRRLIHGSLLVISIDNFQTFYFALLDNRVTPNKSSTNFSISALVINEFIKIKKYTKCVIIEPRVFFHPYFEVLRTLKSMSTDILPMEKYIIQVRTEIDPPIYTNKETNFIIKGNELNIYNIKDWKHPEALGLNKSQIIALGAALTKEFVIIQGPPGTGKSYLGLNIINILLDNQRSWKSEYSPILVVCYRNNAVDQILESLIKNNRKVVRLGGMSNNELVKNCTLRVAVYNVHSNPLIRGQIITIKHEIDNIKSKILKLQLLIDCLNENKGILNIKTFSEVLTEKQNQYFLESNVFEEWLFGGDYENDDLLETDEEFIQNMIYDVQAENGHAFSELQGSFLLFTISSLKYELHDIRNKIDEMFYYIHNKGTMPEDIALNIYRLMQLHEEKEVVFRKIINRMNLKTDKLFDPDFLNTTNLGELSVPERWHLYGYWAAEVVKNCNEEIEKLFILVNEKTDDLEQLNYKNDGYKLCKLQPDVVGATTTGAARLHSLLQVIKPKIVIFEEAAEVLEVHTITALTQFCEHIVMIGDHQQLRPNPANHIISVLKHKLDISLFERMIKNGMEYFSLNEQHRMRPLISSLVIPQFYPDLCNHKSVEDYPDVKGLRDNMFFLDHNVPEDEVFENESHRNKYEASLMLAFANYILKQGYDKKDITLLTFYGAQLIFLKECSMKIPSLKGISIEVVDNFQGEENKIIILSLVRSNPYTIGFLSKMNRICVALTRAREGFYLIGNMSCLKGNSMVWKGIEETLKNHSVIGNELPLKCRTHGTITMVQSSEDFLPISSGGCTLKCGERLECGHICDQQCHGSDESHLDVYSCKKPCERKRRCNIHDCTVECGVVPCPKCDVVSEAELPCGHLGSKICDGGHLPCTSNCSEPLNCGHPCTKICHFPVPHISEVCTFPCGIPNKTCPAGHKCEKRCGIECGECVVDTLVNLPCGHAAHGKCNVVKNTKCKVLVEKDLDCGHTVEAECYKPISEVECTKSELKLLPCGHEIEVPCSSKINELLCKKKVEKYLPCGHKMKVPCYLSDEENIFCKKPVEKKLKCGHLKQEKCSTPQDEIICTEKVIKTAKCGHKIKTICAKASETIVCNQPCTIIKPCGHKCSGLCGEEQCPECTEPVETYQACGHVAVLPCSEGDSTTETTYGSLNCQTLCKSKLMCGHVCKGTCGECMQGRIHKACPVTCGQPLLCGHNCSSSCSLGIHLCEQKCLNCCKHETCKNKCSEPCKKCKLPCEWKCEHYKCTKLCFENCNRSPCNAPCKELLKCGHNCNGFCGEPCPTTCLRCSSSDNSDERYILLEDCGHNISVKKISIILSSSIGLFLCPLCQTPQTKSYYIRYFTKEWFILLPRIKKRIIKEYNNVNGLIIKLKASLISLNKLLTMKFTDLNDLKLLLDAIVIQTKAVMFKEKNWKHVDNLRSLIFVSHYIQEAFNLLEKNNLTNDLHLMSKINHLSSYLRQQTISRNQMVQFKDELLRLSVLCELAKVEERTIIERDTLIKKCFDKAWKSTCSIKIFNEKHILSLNENLIASNIQINTRLVQSELLNIFDKYYQLTLHRKNWLKCKKDGHLFYNIDNTVLQCPTCVKGKQEYLP